MFTSSLLNGTFIFLPSAAFFAFSPDPASAVSLMPRLFCSCGTMTNLVMPNASAGIRTMLTISGSQAFAAPAAAGAAAAPSPSGLFFSSAIKSEVQVDERLENFIARGDDLAVGFIGALRGDE